MDTSVHIAILALVITRDAFYDLLDSEGVAVMRIVRAGARTDKGMVVISSGLSGKEKIIDNPPPGIASGWQPKKPK